jgi:3-deoxy-D-manno-octulosonate 8-phosphate phosphatase (KDO 8-P phosphatase)
MTDGGISLDDQGIETKRFHVRDGTGIRIWMSLGFQVAIITGRSGMSVRHRANELGITHVIQGVPKKLEAFGNLLNELELPASQAAMLGDDLPDLPLLRMAGYPMAVADAVPEVREIAEFTTIRPGGHAAVREAIEHMLREKGLWNQAPGIFE